MNPAAVRAALEGVVTLATGIAATSLFWVNRPRVVHDPQYAVLRLSGFGSRGRDAITYQYYPAPVDNLEPHQKGLRDAVWAVQFWSHDAIDTADALTLCMALRDRLHLDEVRDALQAVDVGVADVASMVDLDRTGDQRQLSVAQLDVRLNSNSDVAGTRIGYVETWQITGSVTLPYGGTATVINNERMP